MPEVLPRDIVSNRTEGRFSVGADVSQPSRETRPGESLPASAAPPLPS